jgi:hypothetical protein
MLEVLRAHPGLHGIQSGLGALTLIGPGIFPGSPLVNQAAATLRTLGITSLAQQTSPGKCRWLLQAAEINLAVQTLHEKHLGS